MVDVDWEYPRVILASLVVVLLVALVVAASTSSAAFGVYNPAWDGASDLRAEANAVGVDSEIARNVSAYGSATPDQTVAVVLSPDRGYTDAEAQRLRRFVRQGGTLVVAEDFGDHSNDLLEAVGATARFDGRLLRDERRNFESPSMPVATNVSNHSLVANVSRLTLNHGTVVEPNNATVLVSSSGFGYLDGNRNGDLDDNETLGTYPVATVESVGGGRVVAVSDPSLAINAMLERKGNQAFVRALFAGEQTVLLDYSHAARLPPLALAVLVLRETSLLQLLLGGSLVAGVAVWVRRPDVVARGRAAIRDRMGGERVHAHPRASDASLVDYLADRHPDWDRERVQRVVRAVREREE